MEASSFSPMAADYHHESSSGGPLLVPSNKERRRHGNGGGSGAKKSSGSGGSGTSRAASKLSTDRQSVAARERRHRISDRFKILQSLVPGGTKMDTVSMLEGAIHYVNFLKAQIWLHEAMINSVTVTTTDQSNSNSNSNSSITSSNNDNNNNTGFFNGAATTNHEYYHHHHHLSNNGDYPPPPHFMMGDGGVLPTVDDEWQLQANSGAVAPPPYTTPLQRVFVEGGADGAQFQEAV
ncbi:unnamed protein product, partial [Cuscuta europaea]